MKNRALQNVLIFSLTNKESRTAECISVLSG